MQNNLTTAQSKWMDNATGPVTIRMTNDYLFRALMQRNNTVLKALICSLLHLKMKSVTSVRITNPIELGKHVDDKDFYLDVKVELDYHTIINLEMQVINDGYWPERSLSYLCRAFDNIPKGGNYKDLKPTIHIGILDFTLFPDFPELFATYWLMNEKNYHVYSRKFRLSVLDLTQIKLAKEEDKHYKIDYWANLFKATTWEELKMLAKSDEYMQEAVDTVYQLSKEEEIRLQCEAREDYNRRMSGINQQLENLMAERDQIAAEKDQIAAEKDQLSAEKEQLSAEKEQLSAEKNAEIEHLRKLLMEHGIEDR